MRNDIPILLVEDDKVDVMTVQRAFKVNRITNPLFVVSNGKEAMDFLLHNGDYRDPAKSPWPGLILLDLNMPVMNCIEFLNIIKSDGHLRRIPVVILTTSDAALELIGKNRYDDVLLDYLTPDGTGLGLLEKITGIPCVFITGNGNESVAVMAMKGGAYDYIIKDPQCMYLELLPSVIEKTIHNFQTEEDKKRAEAELRVRLDEEQRLNNLLLQRELRIKELRDRVDELEIKLGERGS